MNPNIDIVTAFFDIGRGDWEGPNLPSYLKRTTDQYFESFERLLKLQNNIIAFTSNDLRDRFESYLDDYPNLTVIGLENWRKDIWPEFFEPLQRIMNTPIFLQNIQQPWNPEYWNIDYVMVNMLKSWFVNYSIELGYVTTELAAWIDFGYCRNDFTVPTNVWNYDFNPNKIHLFSIKPYVPQHMDLKHIIETNDVWITGCHIVAGKKMWRNLLENVYHNINVLYKNHLVDDDQTVLYMCYCEKPEWYEIHHIDPLDWFIIFRKFNNA